jgi:hypothetical protein
MPTGKIFLSYRRDDTAGHAGRLYDRLSARLPGRVFMDVTGLEPGVDFVVEIERAVGACDVLIALIGKQWLTIADKDGRRRIDKHDDFVRLEIGAALRRNVRVIPALVGDAVFPATESLPSDLRPLSRRHALRLSDADFDHDVERLIRTLEHTVAKPARKPAYSRSGPGARQPWEGWKAIKPWLSSRNVRIAGTLAVVAVLGVKGLDYVGRNSPPADPNAPPGSTASLKTVVIRLSDGGEARVYRAGLEVGKTPYRLMGHFGEQVDLVLKRQGFEDTAKRVWISERNSYDVHMKPLE